MVVVTDITTTTEDNRTSMHVGCDLPYFRSPSDIRAFAQGAEELGFDQLGFSEHVAASPRTETPPMFSHDDPWHEAATLTGFLAGVTQRITLSPAVMLVTLRPPVLVAKQLAELQLLSDDRLRVVASVGWNREEQAALGVDPSTRGARLEEAVPLIRRLLVEDEVSHAGHHYHLDQIGIHPRPDNPPPIWMGGGNFDTMGTPTNQTMRRAARLADGFKLMAPTGLDIDNTLRLAEQLHTLATDAGRTINVEARLLTQAVEPDGWAAVIRRYRESGLISHVGLGNRIAGGPVADQLALIGDMAKRTGEEWA